MAYPFNAVETSSNEHRLKSNSYSTAQETWFIRAPVLGLLREGLRQTSGSRRAHAGGDERCLVLSSAGVGMRVEGKEALKGNKQVLSLRACK